MKTLRWYLAALAMIYQVSPQPSLASDERDDSKPDPEKKFEYKIDGELALESKNVKLGPQRGNYQPMIQNFALGIDLQFQPGLSAYLEILGEQNFDETDVFFGEVYLNYTPDFYSKINVHLGNMYYSYGLLTAKEGLLSRRPAYYADLLVTRRGIDVGAEITWSPIKSLPMALSYSLFSGRTLRMGDDKIETPIQEPQYLRWLYTPSWADIQLTYLTRHYVNRPRFEALGLSLSSKTIDVFGEWLKLTPGAELWHLSYKRQDELTRESLAATFELETGVYGFFHRWIIGYENWETLRTPNSQVLDHFELHGLGYKFNEYIHFEYQRISAKERQTGLNLTRVNEEVYRIFLKF